MLFDPQYSILLLVLIAIFVPHAMQSRPVLSQTHFGAARFAKENQGT